MRAIRRLMLLSAMLTICPGCIVVEVAGAAAVTAIKVTGAVVGTTVKVAGKGIGAAIDAASSDDPKPAPAPPKSVQ